MCRASILCRSSLVLDRRNHPCDPPGVRKANTQMPSAPDDFMLKIEPLTPVVVRTPRSTTKRSCGKVALALLLLGSLTLLIHPASLALAEELAHSIKSAKVKKAHVTTDKTLHSYFLLDRTGSMAPLKTAVEAGYAAYVKEQQAQLGAMYLTVAQFDSREPFEVLIQSQDIHMAPRRLERYEPREATPLYDAIERMIEHAEKTSGGSDEVIVIIFTDGAENASRHATRQRVFDKIEEKKKRGWTFSFLGANMDSFAAGGSMNIARGSTMNYAATPQGMDYGWGTVSKAMSHQRTYRARSDYTDAKRLEQAAGFFDAAKAASGAPGQRE